jgi:hypothetical protein
VPPVVPVPLVVAPADVELPPEVPLDPRPPEAVPFEPMPPDAVPLAPIPPEPVAPVELPLVPPPVVPEDALMPAAAEPVVDDAVPPVPVPLVLPAALDPVEVAVSPSELQQAARQTSEATSPSADVLLICTFPRNSFVVAPPPITVNLVIEAV